jgi:hypothetical protein
MKVEPHLVLAVLEHLEEEDVAGTEKAAWSLFGI